MFVVAELCWILEVFLCLSILKQFNNLLQHSHNCHIYCFFCGEEASWLAIISFMHIGFVAHAFEALSKIDHLCWCLKVYPLVSSEYFQFWVLPLGLFSVLWFLYRARGWRMGLSFQCSLYRYPVFLAQFSKNTFLFQYKFCDSLLEISWLHPYWLIRGISIYSTDVCVWFYAAFLKNLCTHLEIRYFEAFSFVIFFSKFILYLKTFVLP